MAYEQLGPNQGAASRKFTAEQVLAIRAAYRAGRSYPWMVDRFSASKSALSSVIRGRTYAWVPGAVRDDEKRTW